MESTVSHLFQTLDAAALVELCSSLSVHSY